MIDRASFEKRLATSNTMRKKFDILYDEGISRISTTIDTAEQSGVITRTGNWLTYSGERLGHGKDNARIFVKENPRLLEKIEKEILDKAKAQR